MAAVKVLEKNGVRRTVDLARRLGVESPLGENLSIALGTSDLTLLEITSAYGALANQGAWMRPTRDPLRARLAAQAARGEHPAGKQVVSPELAYVMTYMLRGTIERGTGAAARALGRPAAAKTGTTNDYSNAWFIGYTPQLATGVWVGYDRPRSLGKDETGSRVAVPIWTAFMQEALAGTPPEDFPIPERVVLVPVDMNPSGGCVRPVTMAFVAGTEPKEVCGPARYAPRRVAAARRAAAAARAGQPDAVRSGAIRPRPRRAHAGPRSGGRAARAGAHHAGFLERAPRPSPEAYAPPAAAATSAHGRPPSSAPITSRDPAGGHPHLLHRVPVPDRDLAVRGLALVGVPDRLHVHRHAVGRAHLVLAAVEPADRRGVVVDHGEVAGQLVAEGVRGAHDVVPLLQQGQHRHRDRGQLGMEAQDHPLLPAHLLLAIGVGEEREQRPVHPRRGLDHERHHVLLPLLVEVA